MEQIARKKCSKCKVNLPLTHFKSKRDETLSKMCIQCLEKSKEVIERNKCEHGKRRTLCKECGGGSYCEHDKIRTDCIDCKGGSICEHEKRKRDCLECNGSQRCEHGKRKARCKECDGGSYCQHKREKYRCNQCQGVSICCHNIRRDACKECHPNSYLTNIVRNRIRQALKKDKSQHSIEYLGLDIESYKYHIEQLFEEGMSWDNYGSEWHIDHIIPLSYENPTLEEVIDRLHFSNTQPMWASENVSKGNRYIG